MSCDLPLILTTLSLSLSHTGLLVKIPDPDMYLAELLNSVS